VVVGISLCGRQVSLRHLPPFRSVQACPTGAETRLRGHAGRGLRRITRDCPWRKPGALKQNGCDIFICPDLPPRMPPDLPRHGEAGCGAMSRQGRLLTPKKHTALLLALGVLDNRGDNLRAYAELGCN
jgi:hypothetical protein